MFEYSQVRSNIGVTTVAAAVVLGLLNAPFERPPIAVKAAVAEVQLQAVATQIAALASTDAAITPNPSASPNTVEISVPQTYASVEMTDPIGLIRQLLFWASLPVGLAIAPFWYLGAPITYPLFALATTGTTNTTYASIFTMIGWAVAPFSLSYAFVPRLQTPVTYTYSAASRPRATASTPVPGSSQSATLVTSASTDVGETRPNAAPVAQPSWASSRTITDSPRAPRNVTRPSVAAAQLSLSVTGPDSARRTSAATPRAASADRATTESKSVAGVGQTPKATKLPRGHRRSDNSSAR